MDEDDDFRSPKDDAPYFSSYFIPGYELQAGLGSFRDDKEVIAKNDELLVKRFGEWSLLNTHAHRKFSVIYEPSKMVRLGPERDEFEANRQKWCLSWRHVIISIEIFPRCVACADIV